jgi:hypothetical protein
VQCTCVIAKPSDLSQLGNVRRSLTGEQKEAIAVGQSDRYSPPAPAQFAKSTWQISSGAESYTICSLPCLDNNSIPTLLPAPEPALSMLPVRRYYDVCFPCSQLLLPHSRRYFTSGSADQCHSLTVVVCFIPVPARD